MWAVSEDPQAFRESREIPRRSCPATHPNAHRHQTRQASQLSSVQKGSPTPFSLDTFTKYISASQKSKRIAGLLTQRISQT